MATGGTMTGWRQFPRCAHARNALALLLGYAASIGVTRLLAGYRGQ
jgi:hypothetical protein